MTDVDSIVRKITGGGLKECGATGEFPKIYLNERVGGERCVLSDIDQGMLEDIAGTEAPGERRGPAEVEGVCCEERGRTCDVNAVVAAARRKHDDKNGLHIPFPVSGCQNKSSRY